jgi:serine/threonine-protein kinase
MGEFVLRERLDEGGFGTVYRCEQPTLGREAVVKVLHRRLRCHDIQLQRFLREAQLASRRDHPYAALVYAFGAEEDDGLLWIAMELVQGITLKRWLRDHGPMPLPQFVPFFEHVAEVVQTAHERGIVHRDLKPSNVMVIERAGRLLPKLLDFGVAKLLDGEALPGSTPDTIERLRALVVEKVPDDVLKEFRVGASTVTGSSPASQRGGESRLTRDSATIGTPAYMAPEPWSRAVAVGPSADLYALAVVAYEALTGRRPFEGMSRADFVELHSHGKVPPLGGSFPPALDPMFQRALAKRPEDRFRTALELAEALRKSAGLGASGADLPRIDAGVRDAWLARAPQPLAESVAVLGSARNAHQAHIATLELARNLLRYLLAVALATRVQVREGQDDPALLELVRALDRRELSTEERVRLLRSLVRPLTSRRSAEVEAQARMRDQIRVAAHQWHDRARPSVLLWRGEVLADLERWTRQPAGAAPLGKLEASFVAASRRAGRRAWWIRRLLAAAAVGIVLAAIAYRAVLQTRREVAEMSVTQAEVEQGRQALLHDDAVEAQLHLSEAYRRGDHSPGTAFMLARALQPLRAEQARFAAVAGRMWSAAFSPDGRRIVTTDDACARIWDARTYQLRFTLPHGDAVYDARYSAGGARLVTASGDGAVRIWDASSGALVHTLAPPRPTVRRPATSSRPSRPTTGSLRRSTRQAWWRTSGTRPPAQRSPS